MNAQEVEQIRQEIQATEDVLFKSVTPQVTPPVTPPAETPPEILPTPPPVMPPVVPPTEPPVTPTPVELPPVEPPPVLPEIPPVTPPVTPPVEDFKHKYEVLQGKYNKEIKRANDAAKQASDRVQTLEYERTQLIGQVRDLTSRLERLEKGEKPPTISTITSDYDPEKDPDGEYLKREFPEAWGAFKKVMAKTAEAAVAQVRNDLKQVDQSVKDVAEQGRLSASSNFNRYLDDNVKGWRTIDVDPGFAIWLQSPAPYTNIPKMNLIQKAIREFDGPTASKFFIDYALENSADELTPPPPMPPVKSITPVSITPPRSVTPPVPPRPQNTDFITTQEIDQFYNDQISGKYRGREAERLAQEKRIEKAVTEGRVK